MDPTQHTTSNGQLPQPDSRNDLVEYFFLFLRNWHWLTLGLAIGLTVAWLHLRYSTNIYQVKGTVLINEKEQRSFSEEMIVEDLGFAAKSNVENDLQILKSSSLMRRVVDSLGINVTYHQEGRVKTTEQYKSTVPFRLTQAEPMEKAYGRTIRIKSLDGEDFILIRGESDTVLCHYGVPFTDGEVAYTIEKRYDTPLDNPFAIQISHPDQTARAYAGGLQLQSVGRSNVISMALQDAVPDKAIDVIYTLIAQYNESIIEQKNSSGRQTLKFIDERLKFITEELYDVEKEVEGFKRDKDLPVDVGVRAQDYLSKVNIADEQLMELNLQLDLIAGLESFIRADSNRYKSLPVSSQVLEGTLSGLAKQYNELVFQREQRMEAATSNNPAVATFDEQLGYLRRSILQSIETVQSEITERKGRLEQRLAPIERQISSIPTSERELLQIMRQQQIKEQLFLFLLQKREETALSIAAQVANSRILDAPVSQGPVSPNRRQIYMLAVLLGLALPGGLIFLRNYLDNKIYSRQDIQRATATPFLGVIGQSKKEGPIVVGKGSRSAVAEMFRLLRTNLQFTAAGKDRKVILVTSSVSGEGKSFVTINLGISQALSGKRTILLGLDLRKPKLSEYLTGHKALMGVTSYLVGETAIQDIIHPVEGYENLDFIGCGPIPPNPAELLMTEKIGRLFDQLKEQYDTILIDTAPVGLVTDAQLLGRYADQSIMVTRFAKTTTPLLQLIDDIYRNKKLPNMGIVLNGMKASRGYGYGYGGYGAYGGYGRYGGSYGYGYYEEEKKKKKRWGVF